MTKAAFPSVDILGIRVNAVTMDQTVDFIRETIHLNKHAHICTPNIDHLVLAQTDTEFRGALLNAALVAPDSHWVVWAARFLGHRLPEVVAGSELLVRFSAVTAREGFRVFFLGAAPGVAEVAAKRLSEQFPGFQVVGANGPDRATLNDARSCASVIKEINSVRTQVLFVAFGAPYQEKWIARYLADLNANVAIGVGSALDYVAGAQRRAPRWMYHAGLEWLYRMACDPRRLVPRYLFRDPVFFWFLLMQKLRMGRQGR